MVKYREIYCKSILNKSGIIGIDYALNPYIGCEHKCRYCYAIFMKRFTDHRESWGEFVDIKINAPDVLRDQIKKLQKKCHISFGTVCDPYQPVEFKYEITRDCLEMLRYFGHKISILTKSQLVVRDIDLIKKIKEIEIGFTITTLDKKIKEIFEPNSPPVLDRLDALKNISRHNIATWVFVAPILPYITDSSDALIELIKMVEDAGALSISFDTLNPYPNVWHNVFELIKKYFPELTAAYNYYYSNKTQYEKELKRKIIEIGKDFQIKIDFAF